METISQVLYDLTCGKINEDQAESIINQHIEAARMTSDEENLRDQFAGMVMKSIFAGEGARMVADRDKRYDETNWSEVVALNSYEMADAMLEARKK